MEQYDYIIKEKIKGLFKKSTYYDVYEKFYEEINHNIFRIDYQLYKSGFKTEQEARKFIENLKPIDPPIFKNKISEPVISFVKCFKENHRRFKIERLNKIWSDHAEIRITDLITKESYELVFEYSVLCEKIVISPTSENLKWATNEELDYLFHEIYTFLGDRKKKLTEIRNNRQRKRLMEVYCK